MKPEHTACTSKAAPRVMPRDAWDHGGGRGEGVVGRRRRENHHVDVRRRQAGPAERVARRGDREIRGLLAVIGDVALMDPGPLHDPFMGRVDAFGELVIGDDPGRQVGAAAGDDRAARHQEAAASAATGPGW